MSLFYSYLSYALRPSPFALRPLSFDLRPPTSDLYPLPFDPAFLSANQATRLPKRQSKVVEGGQDVRIDQLAQHLIYEYKR